jgi:hypothetical protein
MNSYNVLDDWRSVPSRGKVVLFLSLTMSALGPIRTPVQRLLGALFPSVNRLRRETYHLAHHLLQKLGMLDLQFHYPIHHNGFMFKFYLHL